MKRAEILITMEVNFMNNERIKSFKISNYNLIHNGMVEQDKFNMISEIRKNQMDSCINNLRKFCVIVF